MASCQKYFSIIRESSQTHNVLAAGLPLTVKVTSTFPKGNEWAKPAEPFPWGSQKEWTSAPLLWRREEYVERSGSAAAGVWGAGSHSSANTYSQETVKQSIPCLATTVTYRPNCQIDLPGHRDTATRRSCFQHSPLLFPQFSGNLRSPQNTCTIITFDSQTGGKGTLGPSWSTLIQNYLLTRKSGTWSSPESTMAWEYHTYWTPIVCKHSLF